jgi:TRAP-type uncharacterized transport system substrate-binding protein
MAEAPKPIRFNASWSTQFRFTQAIGRGLSELMPVTATVLVGRRGDEGLAEGEVDIVYTKSVNNEHQFNGRGFFSNGPARPWLRTIAWLPQEDRLLFAVAPELNISTFEELAERKPALKMVAQTGSTEPFLKAYGFSYADIRSWGGSIGSMEHTARDAKERRDRGELDAFFGDGSAYDFSAWTWVAQHGYRFLDLREDVMAKLESELGLRRITTPVGFLPGITTNLISPDDSHIVVSCHERLDDELAYNVAKGIDLKKRDIELSSIQMDYGVRGVLPIIEPTYWTSLTGQIDRQWDEKITGAPLHDGARQYYKEIGVL